MSEIALKHVDHLANTIGPRGSTTAKEKEGHDYVRRVLTDLGCEPRVEAFQSATSTYLPFIVGLGLVLLGEALFWMIGQTPNPAVGAMTAAFLAVVVTVSLLLELWAADNPMRWILPVAASQNVIGVTRAGGEARRKVAVMAHVDSHRTPFIWSSRNTFAAYRALSALGVVSLLALCAMYVVSIFAPSGGLRNATLIPTAAVALAFLMVLEAHSTKFTPGANDNASGVGLMLALAERSRREPLPHTEIWWVASGCEEVGAYGSADFVRRYKADLDGGALIVVDNIAGKNTGPVYLRSETLLLPLRYPAEMLALADKVAAEQPDLKGRSHAQQGAYTDGVHALKAGMRCLTFVGYTSDGWIPDWHNRSDVFANVDADAVDRAERFVWAVMQGLDSGSQKPG